MAELTTSERLECLRLAIQARPGDRLVQDVAEKFAEFVAKGESKPVVSSDRECAWPSRALSPRIILDKRKFAQLCEWIGHDNLMWEDKELGILLWGGHEFQSP